APRMRVLMLEAAARNQHAGVGKGFDDGFVGVALLALVGNDATAGEARCLCREGAVLIDRVGNGGIDAVRLQRLRVGGPDFEVLAAVTRRRVHETGASVIGNVVAGEQRYLEAVAAVELCERMAAFERGKRCALNRVA